MTFAKIDIEIIRKYNTMSYQLEWLIQNRAIKLTLNDDLSVEDLISIVEDINLYLQDGTAPVHLIINADEIGNFPTDIQDTYKAFRPILRERLGFFIIITDNTVLQYITSTTCRLIGLRWRAFPNIADAISFLSRADISLGSGSEQGSC